MFIVRCRKSCLSRQVASSIDQSGVISNQRSPAAGGDDLVAVERQRRQQARATQRAFLARDAPSDSAESAISGTSYSAQIGFKPVIVRALPVEIHGDHSSGQPSVLRPFGQFLATRSGSMFQSAAELSTNTGVAPHCRTALAVATNVNVDTNTSSPDVTPANNNAR